MDQAWDLEEALWAATTTGEVTDYFAHTLIDEATVIISGHRLRLTEVIAHLSSNAPPWNECELTDREILLETDEMVVLTYRIAARGVDVPDYDAQVSTVYRRACDGLSLILRQHTPDPAVEALEWRPGPPSGSD